MKVSGARITGKFRVLVVDDEADFVETLLKRLRRKGVECEGVLCGAEGIKALMQRDFDVVLLDMRLTDMDGNDALLAIKKAKPETQVVLLSGRASAEVGRKGLEYGAFDYLIKPVDFESLYEKLIKAKDNGMKGRLPIGTPSI